MSTPLYDALMALEKENTLRMHMPGHKRAFDHAHARNLPVIVHSCGFVEPLLPSMIEAGINNGDMIVVHRGISADDGDIVVARVSGDTATVKRIFREADKIRLQPENSAMEPIYASYDDVEIIGKDISLLRKY